MIRKTFIVLASVLFLTLSAKADEPCGYYNPDCQDSGVEIGTYKDNTIDFDKIDPTEVDKIMVPPTPQEAEDIKKWIPGICCRTNNCCRKVKAYTIIPYGGSGTKNLYEIGETGQIKSRLRWSQDGQIWRCACDFVQGKGWIVHPKANTRCIFPIPYGN